MKRAAEAKLENAISESFPFRLHLRSDLHLARKAWHMFMGLVIVLVYMLSGMGRSTAVLILGFALGIDLIVEFSRLRVPAFNERVLKFMGPLMRSSEINRMSGVPYYLAAAILAIGIFPKTISVLALLYLAFGDPIASLFGILYGDRGPRFKNGKSLVGTSAGIAICAVVTLLFLNVSHLSATTVLAMTLVGGLAGGTAELLPLEVDDNFSIPVVSGFALWLAFILIGI